MQTELGIKSLCEIHKSEKYNRKYYYTVTYFDKINDVLVKRKHPNVVSEYFDTKKSIKANSNFLRYLSNKQ